MGGSVKKIIIEIQFLSSNGIESPIGIYDPEIQGEDYRFAEKLLKENPEIKAMLD